MFGLANLGRLKGPFLAIYLNQDFWIKVLIDVLLFVASSAVLINQARFKKL